jgi:hypothetical protein
METTSRVVLPDFLPYFLGIFGLLVLWQYYQIQTMKGRILAIDIFDRSGIRMYLYAVADDRQACEVCRSAHATVFPPSEVMKRQFSPIKGTCKTPARCIGFLAGLYGAWPEAERIITRVQSSCKREPILLSQEELGEMVLGPWERSISANTDRLGIYVLEALQLIEQFEKRYRDRTPRPYASTEKQISLMKNKKSHLKNAARPAEPLPAA